ncbi:MAG: surfeit locus 1 family protein [Myxococcota bacterium]|jgi:surfeit locus 1 family protein
MKLAPRAVPTIAALAAFLLTARLGVWQVDRYYESLSIADRIHERWEQPPLTSIGGEPAAIEHRRTTVRGQFIPAPYALSAGGLVGGTPGYRLISPFQIDGGPTLLVDRGWVPVDVTLEQLRSMDPGGEISLEGILAVAEGGGDLRAQVDGEVERWPLAGDRLWGVLPRVLGPPYGAVATARGVDLAVVLRAGELREAERLGPATPPIGGYTLPLPKVHHRSYAAQWFAIAGVVLLLWLWSSLRGSVRPQR